MDQAKFPSLAVINLNSKYSIAVQDASKGTKGIHQTKRLDI